MSCPDCYKGFVLPGEPKGSIVGTDYFTPARGDSTQPTKAIILLTDVFGLPIPNPKIVADHFAEQVGVDVWVPDFFEGGSCLHLLRFLQLMFVSLSVRRAPVRCEGPGAPHARSFWGQIAMDQNGPHRFQGPFIRSQNVRQPAICC